MKPILVKDSIYLKHNTGYSHPESINRLVAIYEKIEPLKEQLNILKPLLASKEQITAVHSKVLYYNVQEASSKQESIDGDTVTSKDSFEVAHWAAGAGIRAIDEIKKGVSNLAFCAIRPPGHHATKVTPMGFCLFNNIAIAARYAQEQGFKRVFIIDFDVHHGNGTQDIFYDDSTVFYFSTHQAFIFPHSGNPDPKEIAKNPLNPKQCLTGGTSGHQLIKFTDANATKELNIGYKYDVESVIFKHCGRAKRVIFDYLGRPVTGNSATYSKAYTSNRMLQHTCEIQLKNSDNETISILIEPETGYAHIK